MTWNPAVILYDSDGNEVKLNAVADANNSVSGQVLQAYGGVPFTPVAGSALPAAPPDTWVASQWTEIKDFAAFSIDARSTALGQGYSIWSHDGGTTVSRYETTPFEGTGAFTNPPQGATHFKIAFQNRSATTNTITFNVLLRHGPQNAFMLPAAGKIDPTFPAILARVINTGSRFNSSTDFVNQQVAEHSKDTSNRLFPSVLTNGTTTAFTADDTTDTLTSVGHGLVNGDAVNLTSTGTLPTPLTTTSSTTDNETVYWVINAATDTFQVATSPTGSAVNITDTGTGTHSFQKRGQYVGTFKDVSQSGSLLSIFVSDVKPAILRLEWSSDGVSQNTDLLSSSSVSTEKLEVSGITYNVGIGINNTVLSQYYRVRIVNGPANQTPGVTDYVTLVGKNPFTGTYSGLQSQLSILSTALLTRSVLAGISPTGMFQNIGITSKDAMRVELDNATPTASGSLFVEGIRDDVTISFTSTSALSLLNNSSTGGTATIDSSQSQVVFATGATPGNTAIFRTKKVGVYEAGHALRIEQTIEVSALPTGDAYVEWGYGDGTNALGYRLNATGLHVIRKKNGVLVDQILQTSWNRDQCMGDVYSQFRASGKPIVLNPLKNTLYEMSFEWLGAAPIDFLIKAPNQTRIPVHTIEYASQNTGTSISNPNLPIYIEIHNDTTLGGNLEVRSGSWRCGTHTSKTNVTARTPDDDYSDVRAQGRHSANSTTTPLPGNTGGSDHIFYGTWFEWQDAYAGAIIDLTADVSGTLCVQYSQVDSPANGVETDVGDETVLTYDPSIHSILRRHLTVQSRWVRVKYVNGVAAQSSFSLDVSFAPQGLVDTLLSLDLEPETDELGGVQHSIVTAERDEAAEFVKVKTTRNPSNKDGLHTHVTGVEDDVALRPVEAARARQFTVGASAVQIDAPVLSTPGKRRALGIQTRGLSWVAYGFSSTITFNGDSMLLPPNSFKAIALDSGVNVWAICEQTSGVQNTFNLDGSSASGTSTNPSDALTSNDVRASITANGQIIRVTGITYTPTVSSTIQSVRIGCEARKQAGQDATVSHVATVTQASPSGGGDTGTLTSSTVTGGTARLILVAVSRENHNAVVTSITNSGTALTWAKLQDVTASSLRRLDVWWAYGDPGASFTVTANFSQTATNCHLAVSTYSGAHPTTPISSSGTNTGIGTAVTGPSLTGANKQLSYLAMVQDNTTATPGVGYTERSDEVTSTGSERDGLSTHTKALTTSGSEQGTATLSSSVEWGAIGVIVAQAPASDPVITLSYETPNGTTGVTTGNLTYSSETDATQFVDITGDRSWTETNIDNIVLIATGQTIGDAACEVDRLYVEVVDTTGNTVRVSVEQYAGSA